MARDDHNGAIGEGLQKALACCPRGSCIDAKAAVELWLGALKRRMHNIATQDHGCPRRSRNDAHVAWCVSRPGLDPYAVVEGIVAGHQLRLTTLHDWQQAVLIVRIGSVPCAQFGLLPVLPFLPRKQIAGIGERRHPPPVEEPSVPTDVIGMQMRAQYIVDVFGRKACGSKVGEIGPILSVIAWLLWALLVIARAGVDQDDRVRRSYQRAVKGKDDQAAGRVHQRRLKPAPVPFDDIGRYVWMNDGRLEECGLKLEHARNFYLTYAPTVSRAARRRQSTLPFMRITLLPVTGRHNLMTQLRPAFMSAIGPKRTCQSCHPMSAFGG